MKKPDGYDKITTREEHKHCWHNQKEIQVSEQCGCFYCLSVFSPAEIVEWVDKSPHRSDTALCPKCGIDSVIGSAGVKFTPDLLKKMQQEWF